MVEARKLGHAKNWIRIHDYKPADGDDAELRNTLAGYVAAVDYPVCAYVERVMKLYPNAKVVLTVRNSPEEWFVSASSTIFANHPKQLTLLRAAALFGSETGRTFYEMLSSTIYSLVADPRDKASMVKFYNDHNECIKRIVPKEKLLIFNVAEGWAPLCAFLQLPIPDVPFPRVNDSATFTKALTKQEVDGEAILKQFAGALASAL